MATTAKTLTCFPSKAGGEVELSQERSCVPQAAVLEGRATQPFGSQTTSSQALGTQRGAVRSGVYSAGFDHILV